MSARVLVACIGNVFFGDDGFGPAVARALSEHALPPTVVVRDVGIRGLHLAYELLDAWDLLVVVDAVATGGAPGSVHIIEPREDATDFPCAHDAHGMDLPSILRAARALGATLPPVRVVGCDVACVDEGMGLTLEVFAAVPAAARLVASIAGAWREPNRTVAVEVTKEVRP